MNVHDPSTSLAFASKNALLLEDHLLNKELFCAECISKHWLALEAYLSETLSLDRSRLFSELVDLVDWVSSERIAWEEGRRELLDAAAVVRKTRKTIEFLRKRTQNGNPGMVNGNVG